MDKDLSSINFKSEIEKLAALDFNYDELAYQKSRVKRGWHLDDYQGLIAKEPMGKPVPGGPFEAVKNAVENYRFADPKLIQVAFDPSHALLGRNILMFAKFMGFKFTFGVRITQVVDEIRSAQNEDQVRVWGYSYRTLQGHFEVGEISFLVSKHFATGEVNFKIEAHSKPEQIPNIFYRIGFKFFGRSLQKQFAREAIENLRQIAANESGGYP